MSAVAGVISCTCFKLNLQSAFGTFYKNKCIIYKYRGNKDVTLESFTSVMADWNYKNSKSLEP